MPNPISAMMKLLERDADVISNVESKNIYGGEFPKKDSRTRPYPIIVINASGGAATSEGSASYVPLTNTRMDVFCYAETPLKAFDLYQHVHRVFTEFERETLDGVLLYNAIVSGGPIQARDPENDWPFVLGIYDVTSAAPERESAP